MGSDLLTFLPAVGGICAIVGAIIGGYIGAWRNGKVRERQDEEARDQERKGLLRLINTEVEHNKGILARFTWEPKDILHVKEVGALSLDAWKDVRVRLAQLASDELFDLLADYYMHLQILINIVLNVQRRHDPITDASHLVRWALEAGNKAQNHREFTDIQQRRGAGS